MDLRVARPHALVAIALLAIVARGAHADVIDLPDTYAEITIDTKTWHANPKPGLVVAYKNDRRDDLVITRAQVPNIDAWRTKTRDAYVDQIERGLVAIGFKTKSKRLTTIEGVPVLDLEASHKLGPLVLRVILFRTYALSLAIHGPRLSRTAARAIAKTFVPPPARPEGSP
jgi:hypothetical protein